MTNTRKTPEVGDVARINLNGVRWTVTKLVKMDNGKTIAKLLNPRTGQRRQTWATNLIVFEKDQDQSGRLREAVRPVVSKHERALALITSAVAQGEEVYLYNPETDTNRLVVFS